MICEPHFERTGQRIPAIRDVAGTPMCHECLYGDAFEEPVEQKHHTRFSHEHMSWMSKRAWSDPERRAKMLLNLRKRWTPEMRARVGTATRRRYQSKEARARLAEHMRLRWQDPEHRRRMIEGRHGAR